MVPDTAGIAHAAGGDDDVEAGELCDRLALVHGLREAEMRRIEQAADIDRIELAACLRNTSVARIASGESRKIGAAGISPRSIRSTRSTISSWVRSTAKAGISRAPFAAAASRTSAARRSRRDLA